MITLTPATDVKAGDVFSTDGYVVTTVVLLPKTGRVFIQAALDGHLKTAAVPNDILLPIYTEEPEMSEPLYLTAAGRKWAERNAMTSMLANVALHGDTWPYAHRQAAIQVANEEGAKKV